MIKCCSVSPVGFWGGGFGPVLKLKQRGRGAFDGGRHRLGSRFRHVRSIWLPQAAADWLQGGRRVFRLGAVDDYLLAIGIDIGEVDPRELVVGTRLGAEVPSMRDNLIYGAALVLLAAWGFLFYFLTGHRLCQEGASDSAFLSRKASQGIAGRQR
jgi:hypothetical protein